MPLYCERHADMISDMSDSEGGAVDIDLDSTVEADTPSAM